MMDDVENGKVGIVIMKDMTRWDAAISKWETQWKHSFGVVAAGIVYENIGAHSRRNKMLIDILADKGNVLLRVSYAGMASSISRANRAFFIQ